MIGLRCECGGGQCVECLLDRLDGLRQVARKAWEYSNQIPNYRRRRQHPLMVAERAFDRALEDLAETDDPRGGEAQRTTRPSGESQETK